jgi:hypothetical protein
MRSLNAMLTIIIVGVVLALGVTKSNAPSVLVSGPALSAQASAYAHYVSTQIRETPRASLGRTYDDSCIRIPDSKTVKN